MNEHSLNYYLKEAKKIKNSISADSKKVALLSNFTIQGLSDVLTVLCHKNNMNIYFYEGPYNQYRQEIFDKQSQWQKLKPDLTFLVLDFDSFIGETKYKFYSWNEKQKEEFIKETISELELLIETAINNQSGKIVISNFVPNSFSPFGIYDIKNNYSLSKLATLLNSHLQDLCLKHDSLYIFDMISFFINHGKSNIVNEKMRFLADMKISPSHLPKLAQSFIDFLIPLVGQTRKCLVLDLDDTLWGGIIGEDGINSIKLDNKPPGNVFLEFQKIILELYHRGIILAINSKNNFDDVMEVFEKHPHMILRKEHFASIKINWDHKMTNLISITDDLNIGLNSIVFWDDDPVNRELIRQKLPEVFVPEVPIDPSEYPNFLLSLSVFNSFQITDEDKSKGKMYVSQNKRKEFSEKFSDIEDFLASLEMNVTIKKADEFLIPRVSQLTMKTNQFNLTTKRYSEEKIKQMINDPNFLFKTFSVNDKFGDNGLTGLYIVNKNDPNNWVIDTFLMSCRIMGRNIEKIMLCDLLDEAKKSNVKKIKGQYFSTKKNIVTKDLYEKFGFSKISDSEFELNNFSNLDKIRINYIKVANKKN